VLGRFRCWNAVLLCLLLLIPLRAALAADSGSAQAARPDATWRGYHGFEIGPVFSLPLPAADASRDVIGLDAGLTITAKTSPNLGIGADVGYHYWPVSGVFKDGFNQYLGDLTWQTLMLGGGTWGLQVIQLGVHFRIAASNTRGVRPWIQVGGGTYRVDPNTTGYSGDAGFFTVAVPPLERTQHLGGSITVGADLLGLPPARMGLNATYHYVNTQEDYGEDLHVLTLGVHALFGR
jgi:hypothetical protein